MKLRLDQYLCQNGLVASRERAKALIMAGVVFVDEQKVDKPGTPVREGARVEVRGHDIAYVSRGGLKLEKAMQVFPLTPAGKVCMDIGASTGGFTDCMLQNGAQKVYAVDVGYGQLAWKKGVVREAATHREVLGAACGFARENGFACAGLDFSPIKGPEGNIEFLLYVEKGPDDGRVDDAVIDGIVTAAHSALEGK